ncbi:uncharacterized protein TNCV_4213581 [Trichonephila clavipes]|nr:uncharacterized protein TNCV_4213581 [Trichonephila clavipes]
MPTGPQNKHICCSTITYRYIGLCHGSNLNKQIILGTENNPPEQFYTTDTVSFSEFLLVEMDTRRSPYENLARIRLQSRPLLVGKHHTSPLSRCPQYILSTPE